MTAKTPTDAELKAMWQLHAADIGGIFCYARAVLAKWGQPAQAAEPVAVVVPCYTPSGKRVALYSAKQDLPIGTQLYTTQQPTPPQAVAVPLTDEQAQELIELESWGTDAIGLSAQLLRTIRRTEAAHGIKGGQHVS